MGKTEMVTVLGTRPEIIKLSLLIPMLDREFGHSVVFTSQHYSRNMVDLFFEEMEVRAPDEVLDTKTSDYSVLEEALESSFGKSRPERVVVYGDTNSTVCAARAAKKLGIGIAHVEAGLRCFDQKVPEERNRVETDGMSDLLFPPTELARLHLEKEGITKNVHVVGNTIVDVCRHYSGKIKPAGGDYILVTAHRQENVDNPAKLGEIITALSGFGEVVFPAHPRTKKRLEEFKVRMPPNVRMIDAVGYFEFLGLLKGAKLVITDSGGVQEEAMTLNVPCLTIRDSTERWESIEAGGNFLVGTNSALIKAHAREILDGTLGRAMRKAKNPFGDGHASQRIADVLKKTDF